MKHLIVGGLCLMTLFIMGCNSSTTNKPIPAQAPKQSTQQLFVLGDSLSAGYQLPIEQSYPMVLEELLKKNGYDIRVINGGESGDTSAGLKERVGWITQPAVSGDIALIVIGGNDGLQGLSLDELKNNITMIITQLQSRGINTILGGMQIPTNLGSEYRSGFAALYPSIAQQTDSILIPFILSGVAGDPELNLPDGIHPNASGQAIVAQTVYGAVLTLLTGSLPQ